MAKDELDNDGRPVLHPPAPLTEAALETIATEGRDLTAKVGKLAEARDRELAALDPGLKPEVLAERKSKIRRTYEEPIDEALRTLGANADRARSAADGHTRQAVLSAAVFDNDQSKDAVIRSSWMQRLPNLNSADLEHHSQRAASTQNLALIGVLGEELQRRGNGLPREIRDRISRVLGSVPIPAVDRVSTLIKEIVEIAPTAARIASGRRKPTDRMRLGLAKMK